MQGFISANEMQDVANQMSYKNFRKISQKFTNHVLPRGEHEQEKKNTDTESNGARCSRRCRV